MKKIIDNPPKKNIFSLFKPIKRLFIKRDSYLYETGWFKSIKAGYPCRNDGSPIPWMNYPIVEFLEHRLNENLRLFEYGSGYSTLFYANIVSSIISVEYSRTWFQKIKNLVPDNAEIKFVEADSNGKYCRMITNEDVKFDVVIVDGRDRVNCLTQSISCLTEQGVVLLDDSSRERYMDGVEFMIKSGFKALKFSGLKPSKHTMNSTTVFYKSGNCLGI